MNKLTVSHKMQNLSTIRKIGLYLSIVTLIRIIQISKILFSSSLDTETPTRHVLELPLLTRLHIKLIPLILCLRLLRIGNGSYFEVVAWLAWGPVAWTSRVVPCTLASQGVVHTLRTYQYTINTWTTDRRCPNFSNFGSFSRLTYHEMEVKMWSKM